MKGKRRLVALALGGLAAPLMILASCVSAFGVDLTTHVSAVEDMCRCPQLIRLGKPPACTAKLNARFEGAGPVDREAWLTKYDKECTSCLGVLACLGESPTCVLEGCAIDAECCQVPGPTHNTCLEGGTCGVAQ